MHVCWAYHRTSLSPSSRVDRIAHRVPLWLLSASLLLSMVWSPWLECGSHTLKRFGFRLVAVVCRCITMQATVAHLSITQSVWQKPKVFYLLRLFKRPWYVWVQGNSISWILNDIFLTNYYRLFVLLLVSCYVFTKPLFHGCFFSLQSHTL